MPVIVKVTVASFAGAAAAEAADNDTAIASSAVITSSFGWFIVFPFRHGF
jgi:hypothetical protein